MKTPSHLLALLLTIGPLLPAHACDRSLTGIWKSDKSMSTTFNTANVKLQAKTEHFLDALLGKMTLTFKGDELHLAMPEVMIPIAGKAHTLAGFQERKPYKILFCSTAMIVWSARRPFSDDVEATTFNFEGPDTIWLYTGTSVPGAPDLHIREYFQRVHGRE